MKRQIDQNELFDLSYLNQVFQGNQQMIDQIISLFIQQVPGYVAEMERSVADKKMGELHPSAHKAKSSVAMLGMKEIEYTLLQIEFSSKNNKSPERLPGMVQELREMIDVVTDQLMKETSKTNAA